MPQTKAKTSPQAKGRTGLKPRLQEGYELLRQLLDLAGQKELSQRLLALPGIDDVLKEAPELAPQLLNMAWHLRQDGRMAAFFMAQTAEPSGDAGEAKAAIVSDKTTAIGPCGRSFDQVVRGLLSSAVKMTLERQELAFSLREAKQARADWETKRDTQRSKSLKAKLAGALSKEKEPDFSPDRYRRRFPGYGLHEILKPHLTRTDQFALVRDFGTLTTAQVEALGPLVGRLNKPAQIKAVAKLDHSDINLLRGCARVFGEVRLGLSGPGAKSQGRSAEEVAKEAAARDALQAAEQVAFTEMVVDHPECLDNLLTLGTNADRLIRQVAPVFGTKVWAILGNPSALDNVVNVPGHLMPALGPVSQHVSPELSQAFTHVTNPELIHDILSFAREEFGDDKLAELLLDPSRRQVWIGLAPKFNNSFKYQRDAIKSGLVKNHEDLRTVCIGIFNALRHGTAL